jgi:hypothetical protein
MGPGGGDQFGVGSVYGLEFFGQRLLPAIGVGLGLQLVDGFRSFAIVAKFPLDE